MYGAVDYGTRESGASADDPRRSSIVRMTQSLRHSVATAVEQVEERIEVGTVGGTALNTCCNVIGAGVLALPLATYNASLVMGLLMILSFSALAAFTVYILAVACDATGAFSINEVLAVCVCGKPRDNIDEAPEHLKEKEKRADRHRLHLSIFVDLIVIANNFGILVIYSHVIADSIPPIVRDFLHGSGLWIKPTTWYVVSGVIFFALTCVRSMSELKWSSLLGIATIVNVAVAIVVRYFTGTRPEPGDTLRVLELRPSIFKAVATLAIAFGYHYNVPIFYHELHARAPKRMMRTVALAFPVVNLTYIVVGVLGYLSFGSLVASAHAGGNVVNNYDGGDVLFNVARIGLFFHFICVYPVLSVTVRHSIHRMILIFLCRREEARDPETPHRVPRLIIIAEAFAIVSVAVFTAYMVSGIGIVIDLIGAICGTFLMLTAPGICGLCLWSAARHDTARAPLLGDEEDAKPVGANTLSLAEQPSAVDWYGATAVTATAQSHRREIMWGISLGVTVIGVVCGLGGFAAMML